MGKGGLNRVLLTSDDASPTTNVFVLSADDARAIHIRTFLSATNPWSLRVAVARAYLHDAAIATIQPDKSVRIEVPLHDRRPAPQAPPIALIVAMQRPKVIGRILESAAALGVAVVCVLAADKVEKSYWDCKLFRPVSSGPNLPVKPISNNTKHISSDSEGDNNNEAKDPSSPQRNFQHDLNCVTIPALSVATGHNGRSNCSTSSQCEDSVLPGRPRGIRNHPHLDRLERAAEPARRVDELPAVRRRLTAAVQQASMDADVPQVMLERRGLSALLKSDHPIWQYVPWTAVRVVAHPYPEGECPLLCISSIVSRADSLSAALAIGPEGGWTPSEISALVKSGFAIATLGDRVLRSETAVVVSLGLVHEGLRLRQKCTDNGPHATM